MGAFGGFLSGLLGEVGGKFQQASERQRALNQAKTEAELNFWGNLLNREDLLPEARADVINRWFDTLATVGDKKAAKGLQPARDFVSAMMSRVYPGGESRPEVPGREVSGAPMEIAGTLGVGPLADVPTTTTVPAARFELPPLPGIEERRGPFYRPEEIVQRGIQARAGQEEAMAAAGARGRLPFQLQLENVEHQNRMAEIRAQQEGRIIRGLAAPDPREGANPWDYVTPVYHGDGSVEYQAARRPAAVESALQKAQALSGRDQISLQEAWDRVWLIPIESAEDIAETREGTEKERNQRMAERTQRMGERAMRMDLKKKMRQGLITPQEARIRINTVAAQATRRRANITDPLVKVPYEKALDSVANDLYGVSIQDLRRIASGQASNPFVPGGGGERVVPPNPY